MSRHEYEELVAYSIEALDQANDKGLDVRSLAWNLYAYQGILQILIHLFFQRILVFL